MISEVNLVLTTCVEPGTWDIYGEGFFFCDTPLRIALTLAYCGGEDDPNDVLLGECLYLDEDLLFLCENPHPYPYIMIDGFEYKFYIDPT